MKPATRARAAAGVLALAALLSSACAGKTINHILADPGRYANRDVRLKGDVINSMSVLGRGAYEIDDGTGTLWIVSSHGVPRRGARVSVHGKIREGFNLGDLPVPVPIPEAVRNGIVMIESSHKAKR